MLVFLMKYYNGLCHASMLLDQPENLALPTQLDHFLFLTEVLLDSYSLGWSLQVSYDIHFLTIEPYCFDCQYLYN